jgi:hypothetical protein
MENNRELNVSYLFGAGASAQALPLVKKTNESSDIATAFAELSSKLSSYKFNEIYTDYISHLKDSLIWLATGTKEFGSPDTFAKYLFLKDLTRLGELKNTLSAFFLIEQVENKKFDKRSLIFLTTIMNIDQVFPGNIKILTWNYDFQLELASEVFRKESFEVHQTGATMHAPPLIRYFPSTSPFLSNRPDEISIVHLNGIAGFYWNKSINRPNSLFANKEKTLDNILELLTTKEYDERNLLTFAWENYLRRESTDYIKLICEKTDILVIIGYSFPFFNREIDKQIFDWLKANNRFKKIYYQDPFKSGDFLKNQFELSDSIEIRHVNDSNNYFIPMEL